MSTTTGIAPYASMSGPRPAALAHNIFTVALDLRDADVREALRIEGRPSVGVTVWGLPTDTPFGFDYCSAGTMRTKDDGAGATPDMKTFLPFGAYIPEQCSGISMGHDWPGFQSRADDVLEATLAFAAERQLATGYAQGANPSLNDSNLADLGAGSAVGPVEALALLENAGAATGRSYVIHATPGAATAWASNRLLLWNGDRAVTVAMRTPVIVGSGYIGTDPDTKPGPAGDTDWAFVTGPVFYWLGEETQLAESIAETMDRATNDVVYRSEVELLVGWDGVLQSGVRIDRSATP